MRRNTEVLMRLYALTARSYWNTLIRDWNSAGIKKINRPAGHALFIVTDLRCALRFVASCGSLALALHCEHLLIGFGISFMTEMMSNPKRNGEWSMSSHMLFSWLSSLLVYNINEMCTATDTWIICSSNHLKLKFNIL